MLSLKKACLDTIYHNKLDYTSLPSAIRYEIDYYDAIQKCMKFRKCLYKYKYGTEHYEGSLINISYDIGNHQSLLMVRKYYRNCMLILQARNRNEIQSVTICSKDPYDTNLYISEMMYVRSFRYLCHQSIVYNYNEDEINHFKQLIYDIIMRA